MISFSDKFILTDAVNLWIDVFGDDESFITAFYRSFPTRGNIFTAYDGDKLCGIVNRVPINYGGITGAYIYAAATDVHFRGRGIFRTLLTAAEKDMPFIMLIPAEKNLFAMYRKLGYNNTAHNIFPLEAEIKSYRGLDKFDGDWAKLYDIYLKCLTDDEFIKPFGIFKLAFDGFCERGMIYYNAPHNGFIIFDIQSFHLNEKNTIKIYEMCCKNETFSDIIITNVRSQNVSSRNVRSREHAVYKNAAGIKFADQMRVNLFMEI
jgi:hypothetical protein